MNNKDLIYNELIVIAESNNIDFNSQYIRVGRGLDCGELCIEYDNEERYRCTRFFVEFLTSKTR